MNIFVLCTGRCGSTTFIKAAKHIKNFTAAHESRSNFIGHARFSYPFQHIEVDNRLSWFLGRLDEVYGKEAAYVHLQRDIISTAQSFRKRLDYGIMKAYRSAILMGTIDYKDAEDKLSCCIDYCETVNANISYFLKDKLKKMEFRLGCAESDWQKFWQWIKADDEYTKSIDEWKIKYNA